MLDSGAVQAEAEQFNSNIPWMVRPAAWRVPLKARAPEPPVVRWALVGVRRSRVAGYANT